MISGLSFTQQIIRTLIVTLTVAAYVVLLYFVPRGNFVATYGLIILLFILYYLIIKKFELLFTLTHCLFIAAAIRLIALFSVPALSDDYFRFIWDGQMWIRHVNPFAFTPDVYISLHPEKYLSYLHDRMNSAEYYTIYPAVLQYIFALSAKLFPSNEYGSIIILKFFILMSELLTARLLYKYCLFKKIKTRQILWYLCNPLVIIELTGNVHFEALLILFLIATLYFMEKNKYWLAGLCWGLAICSKLLPLMFAPLFLMYLGFSKFIKFGIVALFTSVILFYPIIDPSLLNIKESIGKYYDLFEFNASIYYLFKWICSLFTTVDLSDQIARYLGILSLLLILFTSFYKFNKSQLMLRVLCILGIFFLFTTMVHPWYATTLIIFSCFTRYKFPVIFSFLIPLSYYPYCLKEFNENMLLILLEYSIVFAFIIYEIKFLKTPDTSLITGNTGSFK